VPLRRATVTFLTSLRLLRYLQVPSGAYVKLQPHDTAFVELASAIGPRELLETALRNYSVLSKGERIMIEVADARYHLDILEVKGNTAAGAGKSAPCTKISLFGNLDLEVDFAPIKGSADAIAEKEREEAEAKAAKAAELEKQKTEKAFSGPGSKVGGTAAKPGLGSTAGSRVSSTTASTAAAASTSARPSTPQGKAASASSPTFKQQPAVTKASAAVSSPPSSSKAMAATTRVAAAASPALSPAAKAAGISALNAHPHARESRDTAHSSGSGGDSDDRDPLEDSTLLSAGVMWFPGMSTIVKGRGHVFGGGPTAATVPLVSGLAPPANAAPLPLPSQATALSAAPSADAGASASGDELLPLPDKAALAAVMRQAAMARLRGLTEATKQAAAAAAASHSPARVVAISSSIPATSAAAGATVKSGWLSTEAAAHHSPAKRSTPMSAREAKEADIEEEEERIKRSMLARQRHQQHDYYSDEKKSDTLAEAL
jgi:Ubiquitin fusion degradation protein UFD1